MPARVEPYRPSTGQKDVQAYFWKVVSHVPAATLAAQRDERLHQGMLLMLILLGLLTLGTSLLAGARARTKQAIAELKTSEQRLQRITSELAEGLIVADSGGLITMLNPEAERLLRCRQDTLLGRPIWDVACTDTRGSDGEVACPIRIALHDGEVQRVEDDQFLRQDGTPLPVAYTAAPMSMHGEDSGVVVAFQDITERKRLQQELEQAATRDSLTGLYNRRESERRLTDAVYMARRYGRPLAVCLLDIDHFKQVNDVYGHPAGDEALGALSNRVSETLRLTDFAGRYGGEEFILVLPETTLSGAHEVAERLRCHIEASPCTLSNGSILPLTVSMGIAAFPKNGETVQTLVGSSDKALYEAKNSGRNRVCIAPPLAIADA